MTPDGVPLVEALDAFGGRVAVAAGTNAGGTVQAPALAALVRALLDGRPGAAHVALHGSRPSLGVPAPAPANSGSRKWQSKW
jgi:glycine/D-amino acid oxidase-like deaminating enzyme